MKSYRTPKRDSCMMNTERKEFRLEGPLEEEGSICLTCLGKKGHPDPEKGNQNSSHSKSLSKKFTMAAWKK